MSNKRKTIRNILVAFLLLFIVTVAYGWDGFVAGWNDAACQCDHHLKILENETHH